MSTLIEDETRAAGPPWLAAAAVLKVVDNYLRSGGALRLRADVDGRSRSGAMRRVVILGGAGAMGRLIARDLKAAGDVEPVVADLDPAPARELDVELVKIDGGGLAAALRGAACAIASLPYRMNLAAMDAALAARVTTSISAASIT